MADEATCVVWIRVDLHSLVGNLRMVLLYVGPIAWVGQRLQHVVLLLLLLVKFSRGRSTTAARTYMLSHVMGRNL